MPIRALLQVDLHFSPKAGIDLPDDYTPKDLSDTDRFNGVLLKADALMARPASLYPRENGIQSPTPKPLRRQSPRE